MFLLFLFLVVLLFGLLLFCSLCFLERSRYCYRFVLDGLFSLCLFCLCMFFGFFVLVSFCLF